MKKQITLILALGILLSLCACKKSTPESNNISPGSSTSTPVSPDNSRNTEVKDENRTETTQNGSLSLLYNLQHKRDTACVTDNGYYYLSDDTIRLSDGQFASHLMYMDFATRQEIYLCSNAACSHNTADCTSVISNGIYPYNFMLLFTWRDSLYIMSKNQDHDGATVANFLGGDTGGIAEDIPTVLYRANLDGTEREKIYTFDSAVTVEDFVVADDKGFYLITKKMSTKQNGGNSYQTSTERNLIYFDLSAKKETVLRSMDFNDNITWKVIGCSNRVLVLYGIDFGRKVSSEEQQDIAIYDDSYDVFATLNVDSGSLDEIYRVYAPKARSFEVDKNKLYFSVSGDGSITSVDLHSGEQTVLCTISQDSIWGIVGDKLYTRDGKDCTYYFIDVNTGKISHSGLVNKSLGWSLDIIAEAGNQVLTIYDYDATAKGDGSYTINGYQYGLISKEDLYAGRDNFIPIHMVGSGM